MHELTLGWDREHRHPVMSMDRAYDFPTGEVLSVDLTLHLPSLGTVLLVLSLFGLWKMGRMDRHRGTRRC